jgi:hypothetical protein
MKKDNTIIKRFIKIAKNKDLKGYYRNETGDNIIICNNISMFKTGIKNIDFFEGVEDYTNKCQDFSYSRLNDFLINSTQDNAKLIEICINDLRIWKKHAEKRKPFVIQIAPNYYMGVNASYLLDLATLTRQDKNKSEMIEILIYKNDTPLTITGDNSIGMLCPIKLKDKYKLNDYSEFLDQLSECKKKEEEPKKEKAAKKANKAAGIIPTLQPNKNYNGYTMSFYGVDYFILSDAKRITKSVITEFVKAYCKRNNFSDTVLNDMLNSKMQLDNIKARIEKATFILNTNADNSAFTYIDIKTKNAFNGCMYFECDNKLVLIDCLLPTSTETKEETPKTATIQDNAADIVADPETTNETTAADVMSATNTDKSATKDTKSNLKSIELPIICNYGDYEHIRFKKGYYINVRNYDYIIYQLQVTNEYRIYNLNYMMPYGYDDFKTVVDAVNHLNDTADKQNDYYNIHNHYTKQEIYNIYASYNFYNKYELVKQYIEKDMQADAIQDTTQDKPHKAIKKAVSLFVVTDKPQPVKLPTLKQLDRIPTYTQRIISRFKPSKTQGVYNNRVSNINALKTDYMTFNSPVSCYNDKCAISGGAAVNSS